MQGEGEGNRKGSYGLACAEIPKMRVKSPCMTDVIELGTSNNIVHALVSLSPGLYPNTNARHSPRR